MFVRQATISTPALALNDVIQALDVFAEKLCITLS